MKKSKLIRLFDQLSNKELREFGRMVRSPFFNQQSVLVEFFEILREFRQDLKLIPDKEKVFSRLYPGEVYQDVKIRLLQSQLFKLMEQYLAYQNFVEQSVQQQLYLASAYREKNLPQFFDRTTRQIQQLQEQRAFRNAEYHLERYQLLQEEYLMQSSDRRTAALNLQDMATTIDTAFILLKLRQTCFALAHQRVYNTDYDFGILPEVIAYVEREALLKQPIIGIYYYCYFSLIEPEEDAHFLSFKSLILQHVDQFPASEVRDLYILAINYCIKKVNASQMRYAREGLDLYQKGLEEAILLEKGELSRFSYNNIVAMGLWVSDYDWVEHFIEAYQGHLNKTYRQTTYNFNRARLEYSRQNYDAAMTYLQQSVFKDLLNNLIAKTLLIKIYYEIEEFDLLESHLDSMKTFIRRKKIIGYHQQNYLNILYYTKKLLTTNLFDQKAKKELEEAIANETVLTEKGWLLEQLGGKKIQ